MGASPIYPRPLPHQGATPPSGGRMGEAPMPRDSLTMTIARAIRLLLSLVAILIVAWAFFDVGHRLIGEQLGQRASSDPAQQKITLTLLHWGDKAEDVIVEDLIHRYEREHPNVKILRINPGYADFLPKLKTMMAAGTPPDIFYLPPDVFADLATLKLIRPIDDYV